MNSKINNDTFRKEWNKEVQDTIYDLNNTYKLNIKTIGDNTGFIRYIADFDKNLCEPLDMPSFKKLGRVDKEQIELFFKKCSLLENSANNSQDFRNIKSVCKINSSNILIIYKDNSSVKKSLLEATEQEKFMLSYTQALQLLTFEKEILWTLGKCICEPSFELNIKRKENSEKIVEEALEEIIIKGQKS